MRRGTLESIAGVGDAGPTIPGLTNRPPEALMSSLDIVIQDGRRLTK